MLQNCIAVALFFRSTRKQRHNPDNGEGPESVLNAGIVGHKLMFRVCISLREAYVASIQCLFVCEFVRVVQTPYLNLIV